MTGHDRVCRSEDMPNDKRRSSLSPRRKGSRTIEMSLQLQSHQEDLRLPPTPPDSDKSSVSASSELQPSLSPASDRGNPIDLPSIPKTSPPEQVLDVDKKTPDSHVPRDPRLIRLTGVHPFNVEAPLTDLFNEGFLTTPELFYVRNHGAVPEVLDSDVMDWELSIEGLVQNPFTIRLRDILQDYDNITVPVTLVCAGNRRKEQNVVKKTKGFSWGPAGVSTALFTGILMSEVIRKANPKRKAKFVCMEGADKLPNGCYGTSVKLNWVMDPNRLIMLAHGMNAEPLRPDHGRPLRAVIPGQIGGRSVKWLTRLILTEEPSDNWYHIYDNRVLPTQVSPEESAENKNWWIDERYAIYDLSCNSAVAVPAHEEQLCLNDAARTYTLRGYAYSGGGRRISRVEVSLDKGRTWTIANINYPEDRYREADEDTIIGGGRLDMWWREASFCWCFWDLDVRVTQLQESKDILVRCMDESMTIQPRDMYWSVLGMMNNPWFRVVISKEGDYLKFEHPTQPALIPGGWMERVKKAGGNLLNGHWGEQTGSADDVIGKQQDEEEKEVKMTKDSASREISIDEIREHEDEAEPWFVLNGQVYDGTAFLEEHPGGAQSIISAAATDATEEFMAIHSQNAKAMMPAYHIGTLTDAARKALTSEDGQLESSPGPREVALDPKKWVKATLHEKIRTSWDTRIFKFKLEHKDQMIGLPTGQHLMMRLKDPATRETLIRSYTPISEQDMKGYVDVLIKVYFDTQEHAGGKMSQAVDQLPIGHFVEFKGPIGKFEYLSNGDCTISGKKRKVKKFVMICGGSGVTPIYQVLRAVMQDKEDETQCIVLDGNRLEEDILCREELDQYAVENPIKCRLMHTLTKPSDSWKGLAGRIAAPLLNKYCCYEDEMLALICGPEPMERSVKEALIEMGWKEDNLLFF